MMRATSDFAGLLDCLSAQLPALRDALLGDRNDLVKVELAAGEVLLSKGEAAQALYVVADGRLRAAITQQDGSQLTLSEFGPGEMAGEMAILAGEGTYGATVSAVTGAVLVKGAREAFERIVKASPQAGREKGGGIRGRMARDPLPIGLPPRFRSLHHTMLPVVQTP